MRYVKIEAGRYQADGAAHRYIVQNHADERGWNVEVIELVHEFGMMHTIGQPVVESMAGARTLAAAKAVVAEYEANA